MFAIILVIKERNVINEWTLFHLVYAYYVLQRMLEARMDGEALHFEKMVWESEEKGIIYKKIFYNAK